MPWVAYIHGGAIPFQASGKASRPLLKSNWPQLQPKYPGLGVLDFVLITIPSAPREDIHGPRRRGARCRGSGANCRTNGVWGLQAGTVLPPSRARLRGTSPCNTLDRAGHFLCPRRLPTLRNWAWVIVQMA